MRALIFSLVCSAAAVCGSAGADSTVPAADPVAVAQAALERNRPQLQCRFAYTLVEEAANKTMWATYDLTRKNRMEFDPRRPIGERWRILGANRQAGDQRRQMNWGARSDPRSDILTLTLEGDIKIKDLALIETRPDAWVFSFKPEATGTVNRTAHSWLNQLTGELVVSRATGEVVGRTLRQVGAFEEGLGRLREGVFQRAYASNGTYSFTAATNQKMEMSAQGKQVQSNGKQQISGIVPICDPAEVARIAALELEGPGRELNDRPETPTGTRVRR
jgi:hypothetical protein